MGRTPQTPDEKYSEPEAQRRFMTTLKIALNTPPQPQKSMTRKGVSAQSKKRRQAKTVA